MQTLYEHYENLRESYYRIHINAKTLFTQDDGKDNCRKFIDDHFKIGRKEKVFLIPESYWDKYKIYGKHQHSVSLYFLGLLCQNLFDERIKRRMRRLFNVQNWYEYEYTWYLTCLYHDVTSVKEKDTDFSIRADRACGSVLFEPEYDGLRRFPKDVYVNYINYRERSRDAYDHGIIAGTELFACLREAYKDATRGHYWDREPKLQKGNLLWRKEHLPHFAYIADAICCHNMWTAKQDDEEKCKKYRGADLDALIVNCESDKLSIAEYPLQFMLCLLDTIEPIKRFVDLPADVVLQNIYLDIQRNGLTLGWTDLLKKQPQFWHWMESVSTVEDWMQVHTWPCHSTESVCTMTLSWEIRPRSRPLSYR